MDVKGRDQVVKARVTLAEILKYVPGLTSIAAEKGLYGMEFSGYEQAPWEVITKVVTDQNCS